MEQEKMTQAQFAAAIGIQRAAMSHNERRLIALDSNRLRFS